MGSNLDTPNRPGRDNVWIVRLADGTVYVAADSAHDSKGYIYSRRAADWIAEDTGGTVEFSHTVASR